MASRDKGKVKDRNRPITQPSQVTGAKIVGRDRPRGTGKGVEVLSATNTKNADKTKGVEIMGRPKK